jgi:hypothetical protein
MKLTGLSATQIAHNNHVNRQLIKILKVPCRDCLKLGRILGTVNTVCHVSSTSSNVQTGVWSERVKFYLIPCPGEWTKTVVY